MAKKKKVIFNGMDYTDILYPPAKPKKPEIIKKEPEKPKITVDWNAGFNPSNSDLFGAINNIAPPQMPKPKSEFGLGKKISDISSYATEKILKPAGLTALDYLTRPYNAVLLGAEELGRQNIEKAKTGSAAPVNPIKVFQQMGRGLSGQKTDVTDVIYQDKADEIRKKYPTESAILDIGGYFAGDPANFLFGTGLISKSIELIAKAASKTLPKVAPKLAAKGTNYLLTQAAKKEADIFKNEAKYLAKKEAEKGLSDYAGNLGYLSAMGGKYATTAERLAADLADEGIKRNAINDIIAKSQAQIAQTGRSTTLPISQAIAKTKPAQKTYTLKRTEMTWKEMQQQKINQVETKFNAERNNILDTKFKNNAEKSAALNELRRQKNIAIQEINNESTRLPGQIPARTELPIIKTEAKVYKAKPEPKPIEQIQGKAYTKEAYEKEYELINAPSNKPINRIVEENGKRIAQKMGTYDKDTIIKNYTDKYNLNLPKGVQWEYYEPKAGKQAETSFIRNKKTGEVVGAKIKIATGINKDMEIGTIRHEIEHIKDKIEAPTFKATNIKPTPKFTAKETFEEAAKGHHKNYKWFDMEYNRRWQVKEAIKRGEQVEPAILKELNLENWKPKPETKVSVPKPIQETKIETPQPIKQIEQPKQIPTPKIQPVTKAEPVLVQPSAEIPPLKQPSKPFYKRKQEEGLSRFASKTVQESPKVTQEVKQGLQEKKVSYVKADNKEQWAEATARVAKDSEGEYRRIMKLESFADKGRDVAVALKLADDMMAKGQNEAAVELLAHVSKTAGTQSGQSIQALNLLGKLTPTGMTRYAQGIAERTYNKIGGTKINDLRYTINKLEKEIATMPKDTPLNMQLLAERSQRLKQAKTDLQKLEAKLSKLNLTGKLTPEQSKTVYDNMRIYKSDSSTIAEKEIAKGYVDKVLTELEGPANLREHIKGWQRINMLLNIPTGLANFSGNVAQRLVDEVKENTLKAFVDYIQAAKKSKSFVKPFTMPEATGRTTPFAVPFANKAFWQGVPGLGRGFSKLWRDFKLGIDTNPSRGFLEIPHKRTFKNNILNNIDRIAGMIVSDYPFLESAKATRTAQLKRLYKRNTLTEEMEQDVMKYALRKVFQDDSALSNKITKMVNDSGIIGDLIFPFKKTPANILDRTLDYTPVSLGKIIHQLATTKGSKFDSNLFSERLSSFFTGAGLAALAYGMVSKDIMTGGYSDNQKKKQQQIATGFKPYSIKIGDTYYPYDKLAPIGPLFGAVADFYNSKQDKAEFEQSVGKDLFETADSLVKMSFLGNIFSMLAGYSPAEGVVRGMLGTSTQTEPALAKQLANWSDDYQRETQQEDDMIQTIINRLKSGMVGARQTLQPKVDVYGREIKTYKEGPNPFTPSNIFTNFISPFKWSKDTSTPLTRELDRLHQVMIDKNINRPKDTAPETTTDMYPNLEISQLEKKEDLPGSTKPVKRIIKFTPEQKTQYKKIYGTLLTQSLQEILGLPEYKESTDEEKIKQIKDTIEEVKINADTAMLEKLGYDTRVKKGIIPTKSIEIRRKE